MFHTARTYKIPFIRTMLRVIHIQLLFFPLNMNKPWRITQQILDHFPSELDSPKSTARNQQQTLSWVKWCQKPASTAELNGANWRMVASSILGTTPTAMSPLGAWSCNCGRWCCYCAHKKSSASCVRCDLFNLAKLSKVKEWYPSSACNITQPVNHSSKCYYSRTSI